MGVFDRTNRKALEQWYRSPARKPLVVRGARQVGKTTLVQMFGQSRRQFLLFNLERTEDRKLFETGLPFADQVQSLFLARNADPQEPDTVVFVDEIQNSSQAMQSLRFFSEERPDIAVVAAGSLLEATMERHSFTFPVGRIQYLYLWPLTFSEFLGAIGEDRALQALNTVPVPTYAHVVLLERFRRYVALGGMPEVIRKYADGTDLATLGSVYASLLTSLSDDIARYTGKRSQYEYTRHAFESAAAEAGTRITFQGFGRSQYRSREMSEALRLLERIMLLALIYPTTATHSPPSIDKRKKPRLQFLDTGLVNYANGLQQEVITTASLDSVYRGRILEHLCGQSILAQSQAAMNKPLFWVRESRGSQAEVDYLYPIGAGPIPVEVKSGSTGRLRSLHSFMDRSSSPFAIRFWNNPVHIQTLVTPGGRPFRLANLPYYLFDLLPQYVRWLAEEYDQTGETGTGLKDIN